jgi:hypothetical protein
MINLPTLTKNEKIVIFSSFIITIIFWGGFVGYYLIKLDKIVNSETKPIDTSAYRLPTSSSPPQTQQPKQKTTITKPSPSPNLQDIQEEELYSNDSRFSLKHPKWMQLLSYISPEGDAGYVLEDKKGNFLVEISITTFSFNSFRERFPSLKFKIYPKTQGGLSGAKASYTSDKEDTRFYYMNTNESNLWIIGRLDNFDSSLNLSSKDKETIIEQIVQSIKT